MSKTWEELEADAEGYAQLNDSHRDDDLIDEGEAPAITPPTSPCPCGEISPHYHDEHGNMIFGRWWWAIMLSSFLRSMVKDRGTIGNAIIKGLEEEIYEFTL